MDKIVFKFQNRSCVFACGCLIEENIKELAFRVLTYTLKTIAMETMGEIIPFAKEMLNQKPSRLMLKMYMLGTTLAFIGMVGGMVETVCLPFAEQEPTDEEVTEFVTEKVMLKPQPAIIKPDVVEVLQTEIGVKGKTLQMISKRRRSFAC